jgi:hypothetical protein
VREENELQPVRFLVGSGDIGELERQVRLEEEQEASDLPDADAPAGEENEPREYMVGTLATFPSSVQPFGAALANSSFGEVGGPSLFVSDSRPSNGGIYTVDPAGTIKLFTTIPLGPTAGLRQIAFAPKEWKKYGGDLFVSLNTGAIDVVNRDGVVVGKISGAFSARGLLFTTMSGQPTLLFSNILGHNILKAGPGDIVPS